MPNIKSSKKRVKVTSVKALQNKMRKSEMKTTLKKYEEACRAGDMEAAKKLQTQAEKSVDHAAAHGIMHKNTAARRKSRIARIMKAAVSA